MNDQLIACAIISILFSICSGRSRPSTTRMSNKNIGAEILNGHSYFKLGTTYNFET